VGAKTSGGPSPEPAWARQLSAELYAKLRRISLSTHTKTSYEEAMEGKKVRFLQAFDEDAPPNFSRDDVETALEDMFREDSVDPNELTDELVRMREYVKLREHAHAGTKKRKQSAVNLDGTAADSQDSGGIFDYFVKVIDTHDTAFTSIQNLQPAGAASVSVSPVVWLAGQRLASMCATSSARETGLLKILRRFRYLHQLALAGDSSHACMLKVYLLANGEREKVCMAPHNGPLIHDRTLTAGAIYFPQQNDIPSGIMLTTVVPVGHEDYVYKLKRLVSGINQKENTGELALFDRDLLLTASSRISASDAVKAPIVTGISRVLLGGMGVDIMSFTMMKQILCSPPFLKEVVLLSRVQHELCCSFRDYFDAFDRNLSVRRRLESLQRFNTLSDAIMPQSFTDAGYMPQFVGGLASTVWMALRRNSDARLFVNAMYPHGT